MESSEKITPPRDAEGREIPLDTKVLYNVKGEKLCVKYVEFDPLSKEWRFRLPGDLYCWDITCRPKDVYLVNPVPPDSWKKLEEDLDRCIKGSSLCMYYSPSGSCNDCTVFDDKYDEECESKALRSIKYRIRNLAAKED